MQPYLPQVRADRLIAGSRLVLAIFAWIAVRIDPDLLRSHSDAASIVLAAYALYAALLAVLSFRRVLSSPAIRVVFLLVDFGVYSLVVAVSRGAASPFFVFFVFAIICAALRFGVRGSVLMALAAAAVYVALAALQHSFATPGFIILRLTYITIIGVLLTYFAAYQQRTAGELQRIADWPRTAAHDVEELLRVALDAAAALIPARQIVVVFDEPDEPWMHFGELCGVAFRSSRVAPDFEETFDLPHVMTVSLHGAMTAGRIGFAAAHPWSADDHAIAEITARLLSTQLDQFLLQDAMRRSAVGAERLRVGRDLHDGVLQSLTGIALQIETIAQQTDDAALAARLRALQEVIAADQRDLRSFVMQLRPDRTSAAEVPLGPRLRALRDRIATQWKIDVIVDVTPDAPSLPSAVASEVYALVAEALANAAKHAGASRVSARVSVDGDELTIDVEDNGHGFPFSGTYDLAQLDAESRGPVTLKERLVSLGGDMTLSTSPAGSRLEMRIDV